MKNNKFIFAAWLILASCTALADSDSLSEDGTSVTSAQSPLSVPIKSSAKPLVKRNKGAATTPSTPFADTRLVLYYYDPNLTYGIKAKDGLYTNIEIAKDDVIKGFYLSDTTRWKFNVAGDKRRLFIKPVASDLFTSATLVTEKRVYELTFASTQGDEWYQRVTWNYPADHASEMPDEIDVGVYENSLLSNPASKDKAKPDASSAPLRTGPQYEEEVLNGTVNPSSLSFDYRTEGEAPFKPVNIFDDGRFTWLRLDKKLQDMPAIFLLSEGGKKTEVINYTIHKDYVLISRMVDGLLLKLGDQEVKVIKGIQPCKFWCWK